MNALFGRGFDSRQLHKNSLECEFLARDKSLETHTKIEKQKTKKALLESKRAFVFLGFAKHQSLATLRSVRDQSITPMTSLLL